MGRQQFRVWGAACVLMYALAGCSSDGGNGGSGETGGGGSGNTGGSASDGGSTTAGDTDCKEVVVVSPRSLGTDVDLYRHIQGDTESGELFISDYSELYRLPPGATEPVLVTDHLIGDSVFWISGAQLLNPGQFSGLPSDPAIPVLFSVPRTGGEQTALVSVPKPASQSDRREVRSVQIRGDEVYWVQIDGTKARFNEFVATVYKSSWSNPQTPVALYSSTHDLRDLVVAGKHLFVDEQVGDDSNSNTYEQQILSLDAPTTGTPQNSLALFGGEVSLGDDTAVLVANSDFDHSSMIGTYRVALDGSSSEQISRNPFTDSDARDGTWVISAYNAQTNQFEIFASAAGSAKRKLGCIQSQNTTVHAIGVGKGAAYISILRDEKASILKLPL